MLTSKCNQRQNCKDKIRAVVPFLCAVLVPLLLVMVLLVRCWLAAAGLPVLAPAGCVVMLPRSVKFSPAPIVVVRVLMSVWHLRMLADPVWMFTVGLLPMHFVPARLLVLLLLLLPIWFLLVLLVVAEFMLVELPVAPVLVEFMWLLWLFLVLLLLVGCLFLMPVGWLLRQWGACLWYPCC